MRILILLFCPFVLLSQGFPSKIKLPEKLNEVSGLYAASPDSLWWLNDSGNAPELYLTNAKGELLHTLAVPGINNIDWEGLAADDKGNIYIGEFGNNRNQRKDLKFYIYNTYDNSVKTITFHYPDQTAFPPPYEYWNFNMEGVIWHQNQLHLFSKNTTGKGMKYTKHYTLPDQPGDYEATLIDSIALKNRVVTGAAISPNGKQLVLLTYNYRQILAYPASPADIFIFEDFKGTAFLKGKMRRQKVARKFRPTQYEAIDFVSEDTLYAASENTRIFKQSAKRIVLK